MLSAGGGRSMPWLELSAMDSRLCFVLSCVRDEASMTVQCLRHGISRKTGYKWLSRYRELGAAGLVDRSAAPLAVCCRLERTVVDRDLALRRQRPTWGRGKLRARLV